MTVRTVAVLALSLPLAVQGAARADDVIVEVTMVKAKAKAKAREPAAPSLRPWRKGLWRVAGYRAYRVLDTRERGCDWSRREEFRLPGGRLLYLTPKGLRDNRVRMHVRLLDGAQEVVETDLQLGSDSPVFLSMDRGGQESDGALMIMLKAGVQ